MSRTVPFEIAMLFNKTELRYEEEVYDEDDVYLRLFYESNAGRLAMRLRVLGFTPARARAEYEAQMTLPFEDWSKTLRYAVENELDEYNIDSRWDGKTPKTYDKEAYPALPWVVASVKYEEEPHLGYPNNFDGCRFMLFAALFSSLPPDTPVTLDFTEVYHDQSEPDSESYDPLNPQREPPRAFCLNTEPTLVLTEGPTDIEFLRAGLQKLYPDLEPYYRFLEFHSNNPGGATEVVKLFKGLIAAEVRLRVVCLLDNDTAAQEAIRSLKNISIPENFRLLQYPELPVLRAYPTLGPTGLSEHDINGTAGSIEMYLGLDALVDASGMKVPVRWSGYSRSVKAYQGELLEKSTVQQRFRELLSNDKVQDWSGISTILNALFDAFN